MSRTRLFSQLKKAFLQARYAEANGWTEAEVAERLGERAEGENSRREFLRGTGLLAAGVASAQLPWSSALAQSAMRLPASKMDPVLILGAGAAGLSAAYTLKKSGVPFRILEASQRVSGRINTQFSFNSDGQFIERGAELVDTAHATLIKLARELKLEIEDFTQADKGLEPELWYFKGRVRRRSELVKGLMPMIKVIEKERKDGVAFSSFRHAGLKAAAEKWDKLSMAEFLQSFRGKCEDWVVDAIGVAYVGEMGRDLDEQTALNLVTMLDIDLSDGFNLFGDSDESKRVKGGNMRLTMRLAEAVLAGEGNESLIDLGSRVVAIHERGAKLAVTVERDGKMSEEAASQVICTLPFSVLREVAGLEDLGLQDAKLDAIQTLGYGQNAKVMMEFTQRPWRKLRDKVPASTGSLYGDFMSQAFWETSRLQRGANGILTNFLGGKAGAEADRSSIYVALDDIGRVHTGLPQLFVKGVVQNWVNIPTAKGSYTCFMPGQMSRYGTVMGDTEVGGRLLFAGEHTSEVFSGFMNGAIETGIKAAEQIIRSRNVRSNRQSRPERAAQRKDSQPAVARKKKMPE